MYPFKNGENDALIVSTTINFQKKKKKEFTGWTALLSILHSIPISLKTSHNKAHFFTFHLTKELPPQLIHFEEPKSM